MAQSGSTKPIDQAGFSVRSLEIIQRARRCLHQWSTKNERIERRRDSAVESGNEWGEQCIWLSTHNVGRILQLNRQYMVELCPSGTPTRKRKPDSGFESGTVNWACMRRLWIIMKKEIRHILRDPLTLALIIALPAALLVCSATVLPAIKG